MALSLTDGSYAKVAWVDPIRNIVSVLFFKDADMRSRWPDSLSPYEMWHERPIIAPAISRALRTTSGDPDTPLHSAVIAVAYGVLKDLPDFAGAVDV